MAADWHSYVRSMGRIYAWAGLGFAVVCEALCAAGVLHDWTVGIFCAAFFEALALIARMWAGPKPTKAVTSKPAIAELKAPNADPDQCPVCSLSDLAELAAVDAAVGLDGDDVHVVGYGRGRAHRECALVLPYAAPPGELLADAHHANHHGDRSMKVFGCPECAGEVSAKSPVPDRLKCPATGRPYAPHELGIVGKCDCRLCFQPGLHPGRRLRASLDAAIEGAAGQIEAEVREQILSAFGVPPGAMTFQIDGVTTWRGGNDDGSGR